MAVYNVPMEKLKEALNALDENTDGAEYISIVVFAHGLDENDDMTVLSRKYSFSANAEQDSMNMNTITNALEIEIASRGLEK